MPEVELPNPAELEEIKNKAFTRWVALTTMARLTATLHPERASGA